MAFCLVSKKRQVAEFRTVKQNKHNYRLQRSWQHIKPTGNTNTDLSFAF